MDYLKERLKIGLFFFFNSVLPGSDVGTDMVTCIFLYNSGDIFWASMTFFFMWNPFFFMLLLATAKLVNHMWNGQGAFRARTEVLQIASLLPFATPVKNLILTIRLYKLGYGMKTFHSKDARHVEEILHEAGSASILESVLESGPQSVIQLKIVLSTGRISFAQRISIPISIFTLAWNSSRAYFIQRGEDNSDPDPEKKMVLMQVFPLMFLVVLHSIISWTSIAGLLNEYAIPFCFAYILLAYLSQKYTSKKLIYFLGVLFCATILCLACTVALFGKNVFKFWIYLTAVMFLMSVILVCGCFVKNLSLEKVENIKKEENFFLIKSAVTSMWLPSVVGDERYTFITSAMVSLVYKNVMILFAGFMCYFSVIITNIFLLWCADSSMEDIYRERYMHLCYSLSDCFESSWNETNQKVRICDQGTGNNPASLFIVVLAFSVVSLVASFKLHKKSDHLNMYQSSKTFLSFECDPVAHRSLILDLAGDDNNHRLLLDEISRGRKEMINRARRGETPLHFSSRMQAVKCTEVLLKNGAELKEFQESKNQPPVVPPVIENAVKWNSAVMIEIVARRRRENPDQKYLSDQDVKATVLKEFEPDQSNGVSTGKSWTILEKSLFTFSPKLVRAMLNLVLPIQWDEGTGLTEVDFLLSQLQGLDDINEKFRKEKDVEDWKEDELISSIVVNPMARTGFEVKEKSAPERVEADEILTATKITQLMISTDKEGATVLQRLTPGCRLHTMMLSLLISVIDDEPKVVPEALRELKREENQAIILQLAKDKLVKGTTITTMITAKNLDGTTILQDETISRDVLKSWFCLAVSVLDTEVSLITPVVEELKKEKNKDILSGVGSNITQILQKKNAKGETIIQVLYYLSPTQDQSARDQSNPLRKEVGRVAQESY